MNNLNGIDIAIELLEEARDAKDFKGNYPEGASKTYINNLLIISRTLILKEYED